MIPGTLPVGTYAIRLTRDGDRKVLVFENAKQISLGTPIEIGRDGQTIQSILEALIGKPYDVIETDHKVPIGQDVIFLLHRKGEEEGLSGRLRKQEADKKP